MRSRLTLWTIVALALAAVLLGGLRPVTAQMPPRPILVYFNTGEKVYHTRECSLLKDGFAPISLQNAKNQGMTPCGACNPPR